MTTLSRRATPRQAMVLRMIQGAIINAAHAHPGWKFDPRLAKSAAKRAAGTLTSQWGSVLAAPSQGPSERQDGHGGPPSAARSPGPEEGNRRGAQITRCLRAPLRRLRHQISIMVGPAKRSGQHERAEALIEILRMIAKEIGK